MNPRGSCGIRQLARCAILSACAACGSTTLKDLAHKQLGARFESDSSYLVFEAVLGYDTTNGCHSFASVRATVNGVPLSNSPGGPVFSEGQQTGCNFPSFLLLAGVTIPPSADGEYAEVLSDGSMQILARFGDFLAPAMATLLSPIGRIAHPQDQVIVDFSPAPHVFTSGPILSPGAWFWLDTRDLASRDIQLTGSSATFRVPTNVLGQGRLLTWWVSEVPTHHCEGAEVCAGSSSHRADLGPFEIRN